MNILFISGSPRKRGNTAQIVNAFMALAAEDHQIELFHAKDMQIKPCLGCDVCHKAAGVPGCIHKDDFELIYGKMKAASLIIYTSPVYVWGFTAQMKPLLDRQYCLVKWVNGEKREQLLAGKRSMMLTTCAGSAKNNADLIEKIYQREREYLGMKDSGFFVLGDCTTPVDTAKKAPYVARRMVEAMANPS